MKHHYWGDNRYHKALMTNFIMVDIYQTVRKQDDYQAPIVLLPSLDNHLEKSYLTSN